MELNIRVLAISPLERTSSGFYVVDWIGSIGIGVCASN